MVFAEYQHLSTGWNGKDFTGPKTNIPLCGSDGVFICDSRKSLANQIQDAKDHAQRIKGVRPGITGLIMFRSPRSFTDGKAITKFIPLDETPAK